MPDLEYDIHDSRPAASDVPDLDMDLLHRRARRRNQMRATSVASLVLVGVVTVGLGAQSLAGGPVVRVDESAGSTSAPSEGDAKLPATRVVPDVTGRSEEQARRDLRQANLTVRELRIVTDDPIQVGHVTGQIPEGGQPIPDDDPATPTDEADTVVIQIGLDPEDADRAGPSPNLNDPQVTGWYSDAQHENADHEGAWVAAWFKPQTAGRFDTTLRWWRPLDGQPAPVQQMLHAVEALASAPPPAMTSAFGAGLTVRGVIYEDSQVLLDLDADSPGLHGHGSAGYVLGRNQLANVASHYFPDAETLCVAYDGEPTLTLQGPSFLHDATGCPIDLT